MSQEITILTNDKDAQWIKDAKAALADVGDFRVIVRTESDWCPEMGYANVIIDLGEHEEGLSFIKSCRQYSPRVKILAATAEPHWQDIREAYRAGATDVIVKNRIGKDSFDTLVMRSGEAAPAPRPKRIKDTPTILLADNNEAYRETWGELLRIEGYEVVMAGSPSEAEERLAVGGIDLAILDVRLKDDSDELDTSGLEVARKVPPSIPIIIATNYPTSENVRTAMHRPIGRQQLAIEFIFKHESEDVFLEKLKEVLLNSSSKPLPSLDKITELYGKLRNLQDIETTPGDSDPAIGLWESLRKLQMEEAQEFRSAAEARLLMPLNAGEMILQEAKLLLNSL